jgi:hypothetical protein
MDERQTTDMMMHKIYIIDLSASGITGRIRSLLVDLSIKSLKYVHIRMLHGTVVYHNSFLAWALKLACHHIAPGFGHQHC